MPLLSVISFKYVAAYRIPAIDRIDRIDRIHGYFNELFHAMLSACNISKLARIQHIT